MSDWRDRGFVPDSDDEEEYRDTFSSKTQSIQTGPQVIPHSTPARIPSTDIAPAEPSNKNDGQESALQNARADTSADGCPAEVTSAELSSDVDTGRTDLIEPNPTSTTTSFEGQKPTDSTADVLERQLREGLQTCHEVLQGNPNYVLSDDDSPLSSLPSSPEAPAQPDVLLDSFEDDADTTPAVQLPPILLGTNPYGRTLRQRAPLQLHPYTLEYARHQQEFRQRGIRPMGREQFYAVQHNAETQVSDAPNSSQFNASSQPLSDVQSVEDAQEGFRRDIREDDQEVAQEDESPSPVRGQRPMAASFRSDSGDELPDLMDIIGGKTSSVLRDEPDKRPRKKSRHLRLPRQKEQTFDLPKPSVGLQESSRTSIADDTTFDLPISPPHSTSRTSSRAPSLAGIATTNPLSTPRPLLTPVVSSDHQSQKRQIVEVSSLSSTDSDEEQLMQELSSRKEKPQPYLDIRKRIKGVLPASWLKLDAKEQKKPPERRHGPSPTKPDVAKGVAKRVAHTRVRESNILDLPGEESDSMPSDAGLRPGEPSTLDMTFDLEDPMMVDDVIEDDAIDAMLPSKSRSAKPAKPRRRQQKLDDHWSKPRSRPKSSNVHPASTSGRKKQLYQRQRPHKRQKRISEQDIFDIFNAPSLNMRNQSRAPSYVKVAARSKATRPRKSLQKPTQKFLQFDDETLADDVVQLPTLRVSSKQPRPRSREHSTILRPQSNKEHFPAQLVNNDETGHGRDMQQSQVQEAIQRLKESTRSTLDRLQASIDGESPADNSEQTTSSAIGKRGSGFVSTHRNRSGKGTFWSYSTVRPAILESVQTSGPSKIVKLFKQPRNPSDTRSEDQAQDTTEIFKAPSRHKRKTTPKQTRHQSPDQRTQTTFEPTSKPSTSPDAVHNHTERLLNALEIVTSRLNDPSETVIADDSIAHEWTDLCSAVASFLRSNAESVQTETTEAVGFEAIKVCLATFTRYAKLDGSNVLQIWFQRYSENSMIELFRIPSINAKRSKFQRLQSAINPTSKVTDFDVFLSLTDAVLQRKVLDTMSSDVRSKATKRIRSLVSSLSPNNGRDLSHDQVLQHEDFISMANTYALYTTLYTGVPAGCQPRLAQIHQLIDFPSCHWAICELALQAWVEITSHAARSNDHVDDVHQLGMWIQQTVLNMYGKLESVSVSRTRWWEQLEEINELNRKHTIQQIAQILARLREILSRSPSSVPCRNLLDNQYLEKIVLLVESCPVDEDDIATGVLQAVQAYCSKSSDVVVDDLRSRLHVILYNVLQSVLSTSYVSDEKLRALTDTWFAFAQVSVRHHQKSWDDFLVAPSSSSFALISDSENLRQCRTLFISHLIENDPLYLELDRETFYSVWIQGLVQAQRNLRFEHELSYQIMANDTEIFTLQGFENVMGNTDMWMNLSDFETVRLDLVKYVIQCIHVLQFGGNDDSQDLMQPTVDISQGCHLLNLMCSTMRSQWQSLELEQRNQYELFVLDVVRFLQIYTYEGFEIDPWFLNSVDSEFPINRLSLEQMFTQPAQGSGCQLDDLMIRSFRNVCLRKQRKDQDGFAIALASALSAHCDSIFDSNGNVLINTGLQIEFMQNVLLIYIDELVSVPGHQSLMGALITSLISAFQDYHLRFNAEEDDSIHSFVRLGQHVLFTIVRIVHRGQEDIRQDVTTTKLLPMLLHLAAVCILRTCQLQRWVDPSAAITEIVESVCHQGRLLAELLSTPTIADLSSNDLQTPTLTERERDLQNIVRSDLQRHLTYEMLTEEQVEPLHSCDEALLELHQALYECGITENETINHVAESVNGLVLQGF